MNVRELLTGIPYWN